MIEKAQAWDICPRGLCQEKDIALPIQDTFKLQYIQAFSTLCTMFIFFLVRQWSSVVANHLQILLVRTEALALSLSRPSNVPSENSK